MLAPVGSGSLRLGMAAAVEGGPIASEGQPQVLGGGWGLSRPFEVRSLACGTVFEFSSGAFTHSSFAPGTGTRGSWTNLPLGSFPGCCGSRPGLPRSTSPAARQVVRLIVSAGLGSASHLVLGLLALEGPPSLSAALLAPRSCMSPMIRRVDRANPLPRHGRFVGPCRLGAAHALVSRSVSLRCLAIAWSLFMPARRDLGGRRGPAHAVLVAPTAMPVAVRQGSYQGSVRGHRLAQILGVGIALLVCLRDATGLAIALSYIGIVYDKSSGH